VSLRARLAILFCVITGVGIGLVGVLAFRSTSSELSAETDEFLERRAGEVAQGLRESPRGSRDSRGANPRPALPFDPDALVQTIDKNGDVVGAASTVDIPVGSIDVQLAAANAGRTPDQTAKPASAYQDIDIDGTGYRLYTQALPGGGAVQVARATDESDRILDSLRNRFLVIGVLMAAIAAGAGVVVAQQTTRPLRRLTAAAGRVASTQDLDTPIDIERSDEVGHLARSFQDMLEALSTSREQQHRLVLDAGHELRTPLTSMRANISLLERADTMAPEDRQELLAAVKAELGELNELFSELIELATDTQHAEPFVRTDLVDVVQRAATRLSRRADRTVEIRGGPSPVMGDPTLLERAVSNLLGNAHKFSPAGQPIEVLIDDGRVAVRDRGPGIAPAERERVFDRFYRSDATRSMPGSGLGLAIVAQIVRNHAGHVWAADNPTGAGAEVGFAIPPADHV
jgi:two-component system sensor histidine kinase MprB